jgi:Protein of unknown function (DUF3892)
MAATRHEIKCINKSDRQNPHERILHVGGVNGDATRWKLSQQDAVQHIKQGKYAFFVRKNGQEVNVIVATSRFGNEYIKTEADGDMPNNLLSLPECP